MKTKFKLGTRRSLLAWAQSRWVAQELQKLHPDIQIELVGIDTRGDRIQNVSLQWVNGKEFFVAEIDTALKSGEVDFTVHSMKDLSLERPPEFMCGAIPPRENPRDIVIFSPHICSQLKSGKKIRMGTSSPRRIENIPSFLQDVLPVWAPHGQKPKLQFIEIRGNVNTRLSRIHEPLDSAQYLDGVVLAFAGLIRLWNDGEGQVVLKELLRATRLMVLPLKECPAAPAQGALAVECRSDDLRIQNVLKGLHDLKTEKKVRAERQLLSDWGGGCHQRFGATSVESELLGELLFIKGVKPDGEQVDELRWDRKVKVKKSFHQKIWDGVYWRSESNEEQSRGEGTSLFPFLEKEKPCGAFFMAHSRAAQGFRKEDFENLRIWTSGTSSWKRLARQGIWVEGCAEGFGFDDLSLTLNEPVLGLPPLDQWSVLTHQGAVEEWREKKIQAFGTYQVHAHYSEEARLALQEADSIFWSSASQYNELRQWVSPQAIQACGPGKTAHWLISNHIPVEVFPSVEEWRKWVRS